MSPSPNTMERCARSASHASGSGVSGRIDRSRTVLESIENVQHDRCVDMFRRQDGSFGFEEFRRDPEDGGLWTPVASFADAVFPSRQSALAAARRLIGWMDY